MHKPRNVQRNVGMILNLKRKCIKSISMNKGPMWFSLHIRYKINKRYNNRGFLIGTESQHPTLP